MNVVLRKPMTQADVFHWAQSRHERYDLDGLQPVAMTGGPGNHARIIRDISVQLNRRLGDDGRARRL